MKFALICSLVLNIIFISTISVKLYLRVKNNKKIDIVNDTYWRDKNSVYKILNERTDGGIFFVGDSMIERFRVKEFFPSLPVFNRGNAWDDTQSLMVRLEGSVISGNPSAVVISIGGNDIYYGIDQKITLRNMHSMIDELKLHGISISVLSILPVWHDNKRDNKDTGEKGRETYISSMDYMREIYHVKEITIAGVVIDDLRVYRMEGSLFFDCADLATRLNKKVIEWNYIKKGYEIK